MIAFTCQHGRFVMLDIGPDFRIPAGRVSRFVLPVTTYALKCCTLRDEPYHIVRMTVFDNGLRRFVEPTALTG
jgi:hypothetical protein